MKTTFKKIKTKVIQNKKIVFPTIFLLIMGILISFNSNYFAKGSIGGWIQQSWSGGANNSSIADHTNNQSNWNIFFSKSNNISTDTQITLNSPHSTKSDSTTTDFQKGTTINGTYSIINTDNELKLDIPCILPIQPSVISGTASPCQGSSQTYSVTNVSGVSYNWTFPTGWTQTGGGTSNSVTVTVGADSGNITVTPFNTCGNGTARTLAVITTPPPVDCVGFTDDRDGTFYNAVSIGCQCWMAENLKYLPSVHGPATGWNSTAPRFAVYGYTSTANNVQDAKATAIFAIYGVLYNWPAAVQTGTNAICPTSWRVPSDDNWKDLERHLGMIQTQIDTSGWRGTDQGRRLKSERTAIGSPPVGISTNNHPRWDYDSTKFGTDEYGFVALPGGFRHGTSIASPFYSLGISGYWWSTTELSVTNAWPRGLSATNTRVNRSSLINKAYGYSVRCLRD